MQTGDTDTDGIAAASPLVLNGGTLQSSGGTAALLAFTPPATATVLVDAIAPTVTISAPSVTNTHSGPVTYTVTYADANLSAIMLTPAHITLNTTGTGNATNVAVTGTGLTRTVTLSGLTGDGELRIILAAGTASDVVGNLAPAAGPSAIVFVTPNEPPFPSIALVYGVEDTAYTFTVADFGFSDRNLLADALLAVKITTLPTLGSLTSNNVAVTAGQFIPAADIAAGKLKFTPLPDVFGLVHPAFIYQLQDNGGTANGNDLSDLSTMRINIASVNDMPSFTLTTTNVSFLNDNSIFRWPNFAYPSPGPFESDPGVNFAVTHNNPDLIKSLAISPSGELHLEINDRKSGTANVNVTLSDTGPPPLTSAPQTFTITVTGYVCPLAQLLGPLAAPQSLSPQSQGLRVAAEVAPAISLAVFHALEGLLGDSAEGRRLKDLYWAHGTEIVQIMQAQPALRTQMTSVITSFQPLVVSLLSGRGQQVQITQAMTDQLNVMWNTMTNFASPSLATTLNTERTRFNGFQDFVGRDFSQWAQMLQVPAPTKPRMNISDIGRPTNGTLRLEANLVEGADVVLWGSPDLKNWSPVPGAQRQTNGYSLWLTDPSPTQLRRFYRLQTGP